ncbi:MAG: UvrD-helicase domain-containing protein [Deltaproteobacteria bacterium]|nr:UvrD-helicase domain-containing protein [Deltaproteobacteria bacterium]
MKPLPDQAARDAVVFERSRSVIVSAGAGSGKTYTLVSRLMELLAPSDPKATAMNIERLAAITFTRRAAGELKLQVRRRMQDAIDDPKTPASRVERLRQALATADQAFIGTIHSFARRMLLARPVESGLGPGFSTLEDTEELKAQVHAKLLSHAQAGNLPDQVSDNLQEQAGILQALITDLLDAGLLAKSFVHAHGRFAGLDAWVSGLIEQRDVKLKTERLAEPEPSAWHALVAELGQACNQLADNCQAHRVLKEVLGELKKGTNRSGAMPRLQASLRALYRLKVLKNESKSGLAFRGSNNLAWAMKKALFDKPFKTKKDPSKNDPFAGRMLRSELTEALFGWAAHRMQACIPVVVFMYEDLKRRQAVLDQTDLLLKLRDALRDRPAFRDSAQAMFDHILVDECQDTDPLQIEILAHLAAAGPFEGDWRQMRLRPGTLTIVGDPKQSIYRFRRADISAYQDFLALLESNGATSHRLRCNFRSRPQLVEGVFNAQGEALLGSMDEDPTPGKAPYEDLAPSGTVPNAENEVLHCLRYGPEENLNAEAWRKLEGLAIARHLAHLLRGEIPHRVREPHGEKMRNLKASDVAILCRSTNALSPLTQALDQLDIPYVLRGGKAALSDPLLSRFFLAFRALVDAEDGEAEAALLGPPFFSLSPANSIEKDDSWHQARAWLDTQRLELAPVKDLACVDELTQRLIEQTGFGSWLLASANGPQRLSTLRQALTKLQLQADAEGWTLAQASLEVRAWAEAPPKFDPAEAEHADALRIYTTHQSKGLEFPVVVLWDAMTGRSQRNSSTCLFSDTDGQRWKLKLDLFEHDTSSGELTSRQSALDLFERDRLYYVAITRARDLLIIPLPRGKWRGRESAYHTLLTKDLLAPVALSKETEGLSLTEAAGPEQWLCDQDLAQTARSAQAELQQALVPAAQASMIPAGPSSLSHDPEEKAPLRIEKSRHGALFGSLVHRCLELWAASRDESSAFAIAKQEWPHPEHVEAQQDIRRAIEALKELGLLDDGMQLLPEYHLAGLAEEGAYLLAGQLDLVALSKERLVIVDYKTDRTPPEGNNPPHYEKQLQLYQQMMQATGLVEGRKLELYLLFTETGTLRRVT